MYLTPSTSIQTATAMAVKAEQLQNATAIHEGWDNGDRKDSIGSSLVQKNSNVVFLYMFMNHSAEKTFQSIRCHGIRAKYLVKKRGGTSPVFAFFKWAGSTPVMKNWTRS